MTAPSIAPDITLQINICAGDLAYAERTLSALVAAHRSDVSEVLLVADGCRPQATPWVDAAKRFPPEEFARQLGGLRELARTLQANGIVDRVVWLEPDARALRQLNVRYTGIETTQSHDHLGHAFSAYFLGWESARTRYVAHFDADIILWQQKEFSWVRTAVSALEQDATLIAASPRIAPPPLSDRMVNVEETGSGWLPTWPLIPTQAGWRSPWCSTRCHLMDRTRLQATLPLNSTRGGTADTRASALNQALIPLNARGVLARPDRIMRSLRARIPPFPLPPEVLLHEHAQSAGLSCLYLNDPRAWFIHPDTKTDTFLRLLPCLLASVSARGECPAVQRGVSGVRFAAWETHSA